MLSETTLIQLERIYEKLDYTQEELEEDTKRIFQVARAVKRYAKTGQMQVRLIVNQIVTINNVFGGFGLYALEEATGTEARVYLDTILYWLGRESNRVIYTELYEQLDREIK